MKEKNPQRYSRIFVFTCLCFTLILFGYGQNKIVKAEDIIDINSQVKEIFAGGEGLILEGPAMSPEGILFFTDITFTQIEGMKAGIIWSYNPVSKETKVFRSPSGMANGLAFDNEGNLIACEGTDFGGRRIVKTDMKTGKSIILAGLFNNKPFNAPNDLAIDYSGRIYFTDRYHGSEPRYQPVNGVYRIDPDSSVHLVIANYKGNGIAIAPDQKTLYLVIADNGTSGALPADFKGPRPVYNSSILEYKLLPDGTVEFIKQLIEFKGTGADGMKVDVNGNLYIALLNNRIGVYTPKGELITEIKIPGNTPSNLCFGRGKWSKTLFITGRKKLFMIETKMEGFHIPFKNQ